MSYMYTRDFSSVQWLYTRNPTSAYTIYYVMIYQDGGGLSHLYGFPRADQLLL